MPRKRDPEKPIGPTPLVLEGEEKAAAMAHICGQIAEGRFLAEICREDVGMPKRSTVHDWRREDAEFEKRYQQARDIGFDVRAERTAELLATKPERIMTEHGDKIDPAHVQWLKNQADHELKLLAKWSPRYAEKITAEHTGKDGGPIQTAHTLDVSKLNDEQLRAISSIPLDSE